MRLTKVRMVLATATALGLMVGVGAAIAATGGGDLKKEAARLTAKSSFQASIAKSLGTTSAKLEAAITAAATARIDAALAADEITAAEASTLKDALAERPRMGMRLATAAGVAAKLGTTETKLNAAFSDAHKARAIARVDEELKAGNITEKYASELKAKIDAATFPGFGAGKMGHRGGHGGGMGHRGGFGPGFGGPPPVAGSSATAPASLTAVA